MWYSFFFYSDRNDCKDNATFSFNQIFVLPPNFDNN